MFRTGSPYSPFFTSGLLSESPSSSRAVSTEIPPGPRRGSLPTETLPNAASASDGKAADQSAAFYFTLQPRRDKNEFRSFLSLDLAESQSLRSHSLRRKASGLSKTTTGSSRPEHALFPKYSQTADSQKRTRQQRVPKPTPLRVHTSRDSLRNIPSPKPAPSATLPKLPHISSTPPRLPPIPTTPSLKFPSLRIASHSAPSLVISRTQAPTTIYNMPQGATTLSHSISKASRSTASTRHRKFNRSDALACLEGRFKTAQGKPVKRNFMSMSDDEDEGQESESEQEQEQEDNNLDLYLNYGKELMVTLITTLEDEDVVIPPSPLNPLHASKTSPLNAAFSSSAPSLTASPRRKRKHKHKRRSTTEWFPLKSFMDLRGEDELSSWSWRSFVEVAGVS